MTPMAYIGIAAVHLLAAMSPGPSFVVAVRTAMTHGFRPAAAFAAGLGLGAAIWALAALAGLSLLFEVMPPLFAALKFAGGAFLVWIAWQTWRHARDPLPPPHADTPIDARRALRLGVATQLANPKPAIFFGAVFLGLVPVAATWAERGIIVFNILWVETLWYLLVARALSSGPARALYARAKTAFDRTMGAALGLLGLKLALG